MAAEIRTESAMMDLEKRRKALRNERRVLAKAIKKEEKQKTKLIERARRLSDADLLAILGSRAAAKAKAQAKAAAEP